MRDLRPRVRPHRVAAHNWPVNRQGNAVGCALRWRPETLEIHGAVSMRTVCRPLGKRSV